MKKYIGAIALTTFYIICASTTYAAGTYGGGSDTPNQPILIDKQVAATTPATNGNIAFVDNILASDKKYQAGDAVVFKLSVKNTGSSTISNVAIVDEFPSYLTYLQGPGVFDNTTNKLQIEVGKLAPQETKVVFITAKIADITQLPLDRSVFCVTNTAKVYQNTMQKDFDNAQICFEKTVLGVTTVPKTGPDLGMNVILLSGMLSAGGFYIHHSLKKIV